MQITILTHREDVPTMQAMLSAVSERMEAPPECRFYETYDDFIEGATSSTGDAVLVARRGADGMECARNARLLHPQSPLVWFSDDRGFGVESYRIGCTFFSAEPLTEQILETALKRCEHERRS